MCNSRAFFNTTLLFLAAVFSLSLIGFRDSFALELRAGTAKTVITPQTSLHLTAGKLNDGTMLPMDGVAHDIYARVLVLNDGNSRLVIVTHDISDLTVGTPDLRKRCKDELGIEPSHLLILSTHNHQCPMPRWKDNHPYMRWVADRIFDAIKEAMASERGPVRLEFGHGPGYFLRAGGNAPADYEIQILRVMHRRRPMALLFNHPVHPVHSSRTMVDVAHPGYAMNEIERRMPGVLALYGMACGGNQFVITPDGSPNYTPGDNPKRVGMLLANTVMEILKTDFVDVTGPITSNIEILPLPLAPPLTYEEGKKLAKEIRRDIDYDHGLFRGENWLRALLRHHEQDIPFPTKTTDMYLHDQGYFIFEYDEPREYPTQVQEVIVARIGPMPLVALQGEVCAPIGARIKDAFRHRMPIMVFGYMGEHNVYLPTREIIRLDVYQSQVVRIQYASPVGWAPEAEDELVNGTIRMVRSIMGN